MIHVRLGRPSDLEVLSQFRAALWPESSAQEHAGELEQLLAGKQPGIMPYVVLVATDDSGTAAGFAEVALRSYADGCDPARPVGYLEGWYVDGAFRRQGVGVALLHAAEEWALGQGCTEMASDTWIDNEASQLAHEALGFEVVDRCVNYRKSIARTQRDEC